MGGFSNSSLTMSYFHTGTRTIIGAEAFHCPVRDGKEWDHLAMVIRLNWVLACMGVQNNQFAESPSCSVIFHGTAENQIFDGAPSSMKSGLALFTQFDSQVKVIGSSLTGN